MLERAWEDVALRLADAYRAAPDYPELALGPVPLPVLEARMAEFVAAGARPAVTTP